METNFFGNGKNMRTKDPLVTVLYVLLRDEIVPGKMQRIVQNTIDEMPLNGYELCNPYLAGYADALAKALTEK